MNDTCTGRGAASLELAPAPVELAVDALRRSFLTIEVGVDSTPVRRKVAGQVALGTAVLDHVQSRVDDLLQVGSTLRTASPLRRKERLDQYLLLRREVA